MFVKNSLTCLPKLTSVKMYQIPKFSEYQCNIKTISQVKNENLNVLHHDNLKNQQLNVSFNAAKE